MYCECGCGRITKISKKTRSHIGIKKGDHARFIKGHHAICGDDHKWWAGGREMASGYIKTKSINHPYSDRHGYVREHRLIAERALGRYLKQNEVVHHVNLDRSDNSNKNLVICQDHAYHMLIHQRFGAYKACGNPDYIKCSFCQKYDDTKNMFLYPNTRNGFHRTCANAYDRARRKRLKEENGQDGRVKK